MCSCMNDTTVLVPRLRRWVAGQARAGSFVVHRNSDNMRSGKQPELTRVVRLTRSQRLRRFARCPVSASPRNSVFCVRKCADSGRFPRSLVPVPERLSDRRPARSEESATADRAASDRTSFRATTFVALAFGRVSLPHTDTLALFPTRDPCLR